MMQTSVKERQSNFELLRIVSMLFVVIGHFIVRSIIDIPNGAEMASDRMTEMGGGNYNCYILISLRSS